MSENLYRFLPKVDEILEDKSIKELVEKLPRSLVIESIREELAFIRKKIKEGLVTREGLFTELASLVTNICLRASYKASYKLKKVINATGTIIHTNLGRSLLDEDVVEHIRLTACNYVNLEYDLESGRRGERYSLIESLICRITGAEAAMVVNNNAAAVLLTLSSIAKGREVIVSRGELVEIGGSFRIPEVMEESGAILVEVGTTNKTHLHDYERAINENSSAILKVHTSNYRILGFTSSVEVKEFSKLKEKYDIAIIEDLGSGVLIDLSKYGLEYEPTVQDSLSNGADLVTFSGDKLLGGPQAGIIVGKKEYISLMKKNPLTRALRVDKFTLAALEATFRLYLDEERAIEKIPTLKMLTMPMGDIEKRAEELFHQIEINDNLNSNLEIEVVDNYSEVGGGSMPLEELPTKCIAIRSNTHSSQKIERILRGYDIPIIGRIHRDRVYLDLRTIKREDYPIILDGLKYLSNRLEES
ncbi:MAG: L-seryl-tRNA(Sec) selenium transferase [Tissierellia bacterium]|nr:L-seryl-tRNA(Sec) selenium transferase [Tissierellia bacterium]